MRNNPVSKIWWALGAGVLIAGGITYAVWPSAKDRAKQAGVDYQAIVKKWTDTPPTSQAQIDQAQAEIAAAKAKYIAAAKDAGVQINVS